MGRFHCSSDINFERSEDDVDAGTSKREPRKYHVARLAFQVRSSFGIEICIPCFSLNLGQTSFVHLSHLLRSIIGGSITSRHCASMSSADDLLRRSDEEVRQLLRRRKKRSQTSCLPCRSRKVKCDRCSPCDNCAKRGYPELCSFATQGATGSGTSPGPSKSTIPGNQPAQPSTQSPSAQQSPHGPYQTPGPGHSVALDAHNTNSPLIPMQPQPDVVSEGASQPRTGTTGYESPGANQGRSGFETLINEGEQDRGEPFLGTNSMRGIHKRSNFANQLPPERAKPKC